MSECPSHEKLSRWLDTGPSEDSDAETAEHIEACPRCQGVLERLTALGEKASDADTLGLADSGDLARLRCLLQVETTPAGRTAPGADWPDLPGYEVMGELGRGGMGVVYKARQASPGRIVAIKMIRAGDGATPEEIVRFGVEAETVARLQHSNIVQIYEVGLHEQRPYFALEYVPGGNLADHIAGRPQSPRSAAAMCEALARAIQHAHEQGIIHRDLKPANVLLTADGTPKVADFGMARLLHADLRLTRTGTVAGTPAYMAPEQAPPGKVVVGPAADVYALGAILYELLAGRPPFVGETALDVLRQVSECEPVPPSRLVPSVSRDLETVCLKCVQKDPRQRYATAGSLAEDLQRFQEGRAVQARPVGAAGKAWRWCRRNPGTALAIVGSVVALISGTVVSLWFALEASRTAAAEKLARERAQINETRAIREKARADDEADLARGVNTFLRFDLLLQADPQTHANPQQSPDRDIKLRRVLDQAAERIKGRFPDRPLVEAAIRNSIGIAYSGLGEYDLALPHLQASYDIQSAQLGTDHPDSLDTLSSLGVIYNRQARYRLAEEIAVKALAGSRKSRGAEHPATLQIQSNLAAVYLEEGRYAEAGPLLDQALDRYRRSNTTDDRLAFSLQHNLASLYRARGEYVRAEALFTQILNSYRQKFGDDNPLTLNSQHNLASLYQLEGRFDKAEPMLVKTWKAREKYLGANHPITLNCKTNLANLYVRQGRYADAEPIYVRVLEKQRQHLGDDHPDTLSTQKNLAQLYVSRREFDKAEPLLRKTLEARRRTLGVDHLDTIGSQHGLALYYLARQQYADAEPLFVRTLKARRRRLGDNHPDTLVAQNNLAALYLDTDRPQLAEPLLQKTLGARRRHMGADHPATVSCQGNLALVFLRLGEYDRAEALLTESLAGDRRPGSLGPSVVLQMKNNLALLYLVQGKLAAAQSVFAPLIAEGRTKLGEKHPLMLNARQTLAVLPALKNTAQTYRSSLTTTGADDPKTLTARLRWAACLRDRIGLRYAAPHVEAVVAARRRLLKADHPDTLEACHLLADMRQRQGQIDEAMALEQGVLDGACRAKGDSDPFTLRLAEEILERCRQVGREGSLFADAAALRGRSLIAGEEFLEAEELLRACVRVSSEKQPDAWTTFERKSLLGEALLGQRKFAEAESLLTSAYEGVRIRGKTVLSVHRMQIPEFVDRLIRLYEAWGKSDEARRWREVREAAAKSPTPQ
jgi:tetratricopeptide (TPR) repeat protein